MHSNKAFTLTELIVVITILAILGSIGFISLSNYALQSRNTKRVTDLSTIARSFELLRSKGQKFPLPDNSVNITASGVIIGYQGYVGKQTRGVLNVNSSSETTDNSAYTYSTDVNQNSFQLLGFLEDSNVGISSDMEVVPSAHADDTASHNMIVQGDALGILLESASNLPVQIFNLPVDIVTTGTVHTALFSDRDSITGSGVTLISAFSIRNNNQVLIDNDSSLVGYWDMETLSGALLVDKSKQKNHLECLINNVVSSCANPYFALNSSNIGSNKGITFQGISGNYVRSLQSVAVTSSDFTIVMKIQASGTQSGMVVAPEGNGADNWLRLTQTNVLDTLITETSDVHNRGYSATLTPQVNARILSVSFLGGNGFVYTPENTYTFADSTYVRAPFNGRYFFGQRSTGQFPYDGSIQEVRVYNRHLTENEFQILQNQL